MPIQSQLEVLKEACADEAELDQVVGKLLDLTLGQHRRRLEQRVIRGCAAIGSCCAAVTCWRCLSVFRSWQAVYGWASTLCIGRMQPISCGSAGTMRRIIPKSRHARTICMTVQKLMCNPMDQSAQKKCSCSWPRRLRSKSGIVLHSKVSEVIRTPILPCALPRAVADALNLASGTTYPSVQDEHYTSQTCPHCGHRHKPRGRMYTCGQLWPWV